MTTSATEKILEQAADRIDAIAARAKGALYNAARGSSDIEDGADKAWQAAHAAREQVGDFASDMLSRGRSGAVAVGRRVQEQPWLALLVIGIAGVMLGMIVRRGS